MADAGMFRLWVPERYGGHEVPVAAALDGLIELGRHDGAASWCTMIANTTALLAARLPTDWGQELFGQPRAIAAGFAQPNGRATVVDGGLRVTGRWQWGSFTRHATVVGGGAVVVDSDDSDPKLPFVFLDPADVEWIDNWQVVGLDGTGSSDYSATEAFVPAGRWVDVAAADTPTLDGPLYRFSFFGMLAAGVAATAIGIAHRAVEEFVTLAAAKKPQSSSRTLAARPATQIDLARAEATIGSATAYLHDVVGTAWQATEAGDPVTDEHRRQLRLAATDATQRCAEAVTRLYRTAGGEAVYQRCPMEKLFRDANVTTQHAMVSERLYETVGRMALGIDSDTRAL